MLDLTDFLSSGSYPYAAELSLGGGKRLAITYRAADPARAQAAILGAVGEGLTTLGLDPLVTLRAAAGQLPKGDAALAFKEALDALDADAEAQFIALMQKADGAGLADVIGSFEAVLPGGRREAVAGDVTADTCAALPSDVKKAILAAVSAAQLPVEKLDFLGK